jgi:hypothetical protein
LRMNVLLLGVLIVALYFGTKQFGLAGAVSAVMLIQYTARSIFAWRMCRILKVRWADLGLLKDVLKTLLVAALAGISIVPLLRAVSGWLPVASLAVCGIVFCVIYLAGLLLLKVPSKEEVHMLKSRLRLV